MRKLNTHEIYRFAIAVNPLTLLEFKEGMTLQEIMLPVFRAGGNIEMQLEREGFFSSSLKRSAGSLMRALYVLGLPKNQKEWADFDPNKVVERYHLDNVVQRAKEFETVLANEMPGLATYIVSAKGIYSTDDLISHAELHVPDKLRSLLKPRAMEDIQQAGKCLAFELATASSFHMWRAVESTMDSYHEALTSKSFEAAGITRTWAAYIAALHVAGAEKKITTFLDHIRSEYRNPISHPDATLELDEAFNLFGTAFSVIGQMLRAIAECKAKRATTFTALTALAAEAPKS